MKKEEIYLFEKNTDAVGTNRGLLYQYLVTLKAWIYNYILQNGQHIFCEFEDDIKEVDSIANELIFTQVKNYSTPFNINSEEIEKSLYNFYMLYLRYKEKYKIEFKFITNSYISQNDDLLNEWIKKDKMELIQDEVINILSNKVTLEKNSKIDALDKRIIKYRKKVKINSTKITELEEKKLNIEREFYILIDKIKNKDTIKGFVESIFFEFKCQDCEYSVQAIKDEILNSLENIDKCKGMKNTYFSRFLSEVNQKSSISNIADRELTIDLFEKILKETEEEMLKNTDNKFNEMLTNNFENINSKLDKVNNSINELNEKVIGSVTIKNKLSLPKYHSNEVKSIMESDNNSSNLEEKIMKIGMDEEDTGYFIEIAQNTRCRYILYKEELKNNNLDEELIALQALEDILRRVCFEKVQEYTYKSDFSSREFWHGLIDKLKEITKENELFLEYKFQDDIISGQMYEIAAQCPLRWHKK